MKTKNYFTDNNIEIRQYHANTAAEWVEKQATQYGFSTGKDEFNSLESMILRNQEKDYSNDISYRNCSPIWGGEVTVRFTISHSPQSRNGVTCEAQISWSSTGHSTQRAMFISGEIAKAVQFAAAVEAYF